MRYTSGSTPTKYGYTGQYSNVADFGLMYYNARWYDPTIARFVQADTVVPEGVQGLDRYGYVKNAPTRYRDPSGHWQDEGCGTGGGGGGTGCNLPPPSPPDTESNDQYHAAGGGATGSQPNLLNAFEQITGLTPNSVCVLLLGPNANPLCSAAAWNLLHQTVQSAPLVVTESYPGYDLDAFGAGIGGIAGYFPAQGTGGIDALYLFDNGSTTIYGYTGTAVSGGGGGLTGGPYVILAFNIEDPADYAGVSNSASGTLSYAQYGATVSYFWSGGQPLQPGEPQGITIWYSPGLGAQASYSNVNYTPWITFLSGQ